MVILVEATCDRCERKETGELRENIMPFAGVMIPPPPGWLALTAEQVGGEASKPETYHLCPACQVVFDAFLEGGIASA